MNVSGKSLANFIALTHDLHQTGQSLISNIASITQSNNNSSTTLSADILTLSGELDDLIDTNTALINGNENKISNTGSFLLDKIDLEVGSLRGQSTSSFASLSHDISLLSGEWLQSIIDEDQDNTAIINNLDATGQLLEAALLDTSGDLYSKVTDLSGDLGFTGQLILQSSGDLNTKMTDLSGDLGSTGQLLEDALIETSGDLYTKMTDLSGDLGSTGQLLEDALIETSGDLYTKMTDLSGDLGSTGQLILQSSGDSLANHLSVVDDLHSTGQDLEIALLDTSGDLYFKVTDFSGDFLATGQGLETYIDEVSGELISLSGQTTTSFSSISHDISLVENNLDATGSHLEEYTVRVEESIDSLSGDSTSSFTSLSHDISVVEDRLSIRGSIPIPVGVSELEVLFSSVSPNTSFVNPPHIVVTARYNPNTPYIYGMSYHSVTNTGVLVDFSATILEVGHYLDFSLSKF